MMRTPFRDALGDLSRNRSLVWALYLAGLAWSLLAAWPFGSALSQACGASDAGRILSNRVDPLLLTELLKSRPDLFAMARSQFLQMIGIGLLIKLFLSGGVLDSIASDRPPEALRVLCASAALFPPILLLAAIEAVLLAGIAEIWMLDIPASLFDGSESEWPMTLSELAMMAALGLLVLAVFLVFKHARISLTQGATGGRAWRAAHAALVFLIRNPLRALAVSTTTALVVLAGIGLSLTMSHIGAISDWTRVPVAIASSQILVLLYYGARIWSLAASTRQMKLSASTATVVPSATVPETDWGSPEQSAQQSGEDARPAGETTAEGAVTIPIDGTLDLHTFHPRDVKELVPEYLRLCRDRGILQVRIIHGKGTGSLRQTVASILDKVPEVIRTTPGGDQGGGWGATIVWLRPHD